MWLWGEKEREKKGEESREECREGITYKLSKSQRRRDIGEQDECHCTMKMRESHE